MRMDGAWLLRIEAGVASVGLGMGIMMAILAAPPAAGQAADGGDDAKQQVGATLELAEGFEAELLHQASKHGHGSWIASTFGPSGRLYVSAENGPLYRVTLDAPRQGDVKVEPIKIRLPKKNGKGKTAPLGDAQGLCWAFDSLYVMVTSGQGYGQGLYRVTDRDGDGRLDTGKLLRRIEGAGGDHSAHAIVKSPDGEAIYVVAGNMTSPPNPEASRQPRVWQEDLLLPRIADPGGHNTKGMAPGGWIARVTPDGSHWELVSTGYRNAYDIAFNKAGELFAYDSDMEWDVGLPWYRPTRLVHATSGSEFGWRNGSGKWPDYYPDSLGSVVDVGRGSPTGIIFGYGADFPGKYQRALFLCDWSYGRVFAAHLEPDGASYTAELEPFIQAAPFPVVDVTIGPDGAMYLITGGRSTESWLYRVTYEGDKPTRPVSFRPDPEPASARKLRHKLESYHNRQTPKAVDVAWPHLASGDRAIRYAARIAVENQPVAQWRQRALNETNPQALITAMVALARHAESKQQNRIINALGRLSWPSLNTQQKLSLLRVYELCFTRLGEPGKAVRREVIDRLSRHYPADHFPLDRGLSRLLAYLEAPDVIGKTLERIEQATSQQEQIAYAYALRTVDKHWTLKQRKQFFRWFNKAATFRGGKSAQGYLDKIEADALAKVDKKTRKKLKPILEAEPKQPEVVELPRQGTVKNWKVEDLLPAVQGELKNRSFKRGKRMFAAAKCFECHRFNGRGGATGPDLTTVGQRFSRKYILESIINPSEAISNQFQATIITKKSGEVVVGRIVNMHGNAIQVQPNPFVPSHTVKINHKNVKSTRPSPTSMMPPGLINSLKKGEILDLMAYMLSRGDPDDPIFD